MSDGAGDVRPVWIARAGRYGDDEAAAIEEGLAIIGFPDVPDLTGAATDGAILERVRSVSPDDTEPRIRNHASQLAAFALHMADGDLVALPLKTSSGQVALGRVAGPYAFREVAGTKRHTRPVRWVRPDAARFEFKQDLLFSLGAFMTVCRIQRNDAERRFAAIIEGKPDPGFAVEEKVPLPGVEASEEHASVDLEQLARDQILGRLRDRFQRHELARLVEAVLQADSHHTYLAPPSPDGGADILAGLGSLGLDGPSLCAQVKSSASPSDVTVLRALQGTMQTFGAERGLLVSWGGFTRAVEQEARQSFFHVRLWDASSLLNAIYRVYDKPPEQIQAELPLKRVWALVMEEDEG